MNTPQASLQSPLQPFADFYKAAEASLSMLRERTGVRGWLFTRVEGDDWMVLATSDHHYGLCSGDALRWDESICARMVAGGPSVVPDVMSYEPYATAPVTRRGIGAYLGVAVQLDNGALGTLCAIDPQPASVALQNMLPVVRLCAQMLATLWLHDTDLKQTLRRAERAELEAMTDAMTGVYNRRGWRRLLAQEEDRCREQQATGGIIVIDLDRLKQLNDSLGHNAGDALIVRAARQLSAAIRPVDVVARLGGDEFAVLMLDAGPLELARLAQRIEAALRHADIAATLGYSWRGPNRDLAEAYREADMLMLDAKRLKHEPSAVPAGVTFGP